MGKEKNPKNFEPFKPILDRIFQFGITGWRDMEPIREEFATGKYDGYVVIDATLLRTCPEEVLRQVCGSIGITFSERMVSGWSKGTGDKFRGAIEPGLNMAITRAVNSKRVEPPSEDPIAVAQLPPQYRRYIMEFALPSYMRFLTDKHIVRPQTATDIEKYLNTSVGTKGEKLVDKDPVFAYALIASSTLAAAVKTDLLGRIREKSGNEKFNDVFDGIDMLAVATGVPFNLVTRKAGRG